MKRPYYKHSQARQKAFQDLPQLLIAVKNTDMVSIVYKET